MFFANADDQYRFEIFGITILRTLEGFDGYKEGINEVVGSAKGLMEGRITIYEIDNRKFSIILFLRDYGQEFLTRIKVNKKLTKKDYRELLEIFKSDEIALL